VVVPQIRRVGRSSNESLNRSVATGVRRLLDVKAQDAFAQSVILALGELGDFESIPDLIELLEFGPNATRSAAHWALQPASSCSTTCRRGIAGRFHRRRRWWSEMRGTRSWSAS
jgi:hypothetical protein